MSCVDMKIETCLLFGGLIAILYYVRQLQQQMLRVGHQVDQTLAKIQEPPSQVVAQEPTEISS